MPEGIEIEINFQTILDQLDPSRVEQIATGIMDTAADLARAHWIQLAQQGLKTTRADYINGIQEVESPSQFERRIRLEGALPNMIEQGHEAYDMKPGLLNHKSGKPPKTAADGSTYRVINIQYGSPSNQSVRALPPDIYEKAKKMKFGERLSDAKKKTNIKGYTSKVGVYQGLTRMRERDVKKGDIRNSFGTFRTVSTKSDPNSWYHPGFTAKNYAQQTKEWLEPQLQQIMNDELEAFK